MKLEFTVATKAAQQVERTVEIDGESHKVLVPSVIAQLIPVKDDGTGTLKVSVDKDSQSLFTPGAKITVTFSAAGA